MRKAAWIAAAIVFLAIAAFLHWTLPSRDIVRIVGTEVARMGATDAPRDGQPVERTRDVWFINTITPDGDSVVYRNEDTGWGWPPYFKFDSADVAADASNLVSTEADPQWVVVTHYGWRIPIFSAFPNAISIREAESVNEGLFPWYNLIFLALLLAGALFIRRLVLRLFR